MDYICSDHHFFHGNILEYEGRSFNNSREMDDYMIGEWNATVGKNDLVYHLGDIAFTNHFDVIMRLLRRLNGKIYLVPGNHDHWVWKREVPRFKWIENKLFIGEKILEKKVNINGKYEKVVMCHYPMASWNAAFHGRRHFYGHTHSTTYGLKERMYNVCVDHIGYRPLTFEQVISYKY